MTSLFLARERRARLAYIERPGLAPAPLMQLGAAGVARASGPAALAARAVWAFRAARAGLGRIGDDGVEVLAGVDTRRLAATRPLAIEWPAAFLRRVEALALETGVDPGRPVVTLHVRSAGSKTALGGDERDRDLVRAARIEDYHPAVDVLVQRGYQVVRIGDASMPPLSRPGVVDLATHPARDTALDLWCVARSRFFLASDSGPYGLSWLFNVPCLAANVINVLGVYPLRRHDLCLPKIVRDTATGRPWTLEEMLRSETFPTIKRRVLKQRSLEYVDNTPDEIAEAVEDMLDGLDRTITPTSAQIRVRDLVLSARSTPGMRGKLMAKTGLDDVYFGDGYVAPRFAARRL
jgi:putative glycosyltransferase (TIGR04372 family)